MPGPFSGIHCDDSESESRVTGRVYCSVQGSRGPRSVPARPWPQGPCRAGEQPLCSARPGERDAMAVAAMLVAAWTRDSAVTRHDLDAPAAVTVPLTVAASGMISTIVTDGAAPVTVTHTSD